MKKQKKKQMHKLIILVGVLIAQLLVGLIEHCGKAQINKRYKSLKGKMHGYRVDSCHSGARWHRAY